MQHPNTLLFKGLPSSIPNCSQIPTFLICSSADIHTVPSCCSPFPYLCSQPAHYSTNSSCFQNCFSMRADRRLNSKGQSLASPHLEVNRSSQSNSPPTTFYLLSQWCYLLSFLLFPPFPFLHHFEAGLMPSLSTSPAQYHSACFSLLSWVLRKRTFSHLMVMEWCND